MPEGPEIRRAADEVAAIIENQIIKDIWFAFDHLKYFEKTLLGAKVLKVDTHGKAMITRLIIDVDEPQSKQLNIYSHNQLYGRWYCLKHGEKADTKRSLRISISTPKGKAQLYSASDISVLSSDQLKLHSLLSRMGPDVLSTKLTKNLLRDRLLEKKFSKRQLGQLLTDQGFVAGLGNYLRCEVLFVCGIHPKVRPIDCSRQQIKQLAKNIITLPQQSYQHNAITNHLNTARKLIATGVSIENARFYVFRREGLTCYRCGTKIIKLKTGQPCYLCPVCQKN